MPRQSRKRSHPENGRIADYLEQYALTRGSDNYRRTLQMAARNVRKHPVPILSRNDAIHVPGVGPQISGVIAICLNDNQAIPQPSSQTQPTASSHMSTEQAQRERNKMRHSSKSNRPLPLSGAALASDSDSCPEDAPSARTRGNVNRQNSSVAAAGAATSQRQTQRRAKEYMPRFRSAAYALLLALYKAGAEEAGPNGRGLRKDDLIERAQPHAEETILGSGRPSGPGFVYGGWSSMGKTLVTKGLVIRFSHPPKFKLSQAGAALAAKLAVQHNALNNQVVDQYVPATSRNGVQNNPTPPSRSRGRRVTASPAASPPAPTRSLQSPGSSARAVIPRQSNFSANSPQRRQEVREQTERASASAPTLSSLPSASGTACESGLSGIHVEEELVEPAVCAVWSLIEQRGDSSTARILDALRKIITDCCGKLPRDANAIQRLLEGKLDGSTDAQRSDSRMPKRLRNVRRGMQLEPLRPQPQPQRQPRFTPMFSPERECSDPSTGVVVLDSDSESTSDDDQLIVLPARPRTEPNLTSGSVAAASVIERPCKRARPIESASGTASANAGACAAMAQENTPASSFVTAPHGMCDISLRNDGTNPTLSHQEIEPLCRGTSRPSHAIPTSQQELVMQDVPNNSANQSANAAPLVSTWKVATPSASSGTQHFSDPLPPLVNPDEVVLLLDSRERILDSRAHGSSTEAFAALLRTAGVKCEVTTLAVGDAVFVRRIPHQPDTLLDYVFERKTAADFIASISDGRIQRQHNAMQNAGLSRKLFILEGSLQRETVNSSQAVSAKFRRALVSLSLHDGFYVKHTKDRRDTARFYKSMSMKLRQGAKKGEVFEHWNQRMKEDAAKMTLRELFMLQLGIVPGVGIGRAKTVLDKGYNTPWKLAQAIRRGQVTPQILAKRNDASAAMPLKVAERICALFADQYETTLVNM